MSGDDGDFGVMRPPEPPAPVGTVTRGVQTEPSSPTRQDIGERAIVHHFGCERRTPLRSVLVPGAVDYRCDECDARVSVDADGQPVGPKAPTDDPMTPLARDVLAGYPTVAQVLAARAALEAAGRDAGARSIARHLHCNESTVRRRLGRRK